MVILVKEFAKTSSSCRDTGVSVGLVEHTFSDKVILILSKGDEPSVGMAIGRA